MTGIASHERAPAKLSKSLGKSQVANEVPEMANSRWHSFISLNCGAFHLPNRRFLIADFCEVNQITWRP
jgi:hypothetical protein